MESCKVVVLISTCLQNSFCKIDDFLLKSKFTPLGTESGDLQLLDEMIAELTMSALGRGFNRNDRRNAR